MAAPEGRPTEETQAGNFRIRRYENIAEVRCFCGRTKPIRLGTQDLTKLVLLGQHKACQVCDEEAQKASTQTERLLAGLNRIRLKLDIGEHMYLDKELVRCRISGGKDQRPRRMVFSQYFGLELNCSDKIIQSCDDANCYNPYHMRIVKSTAKKLTPEAESLIRYLVCEGKPAKIIVDAVELHTKVKVTTRYVQILRKSMSENPAVNLPKLKSAIADNEEIVRLLLSLQAVSTSDLCQESGLPRAIVLRGLRRLVSAGALQTVRFEQHTLHAIVNKNKDLVIELLKKL